MAMRAHSPTIVEENRLLEESSDDDADRAPVAERLSILEELRSQGLVSQQEYDAKRSQILSEL